MRSRGERSRPSRPWQGGGYRPGQGRWGRPSGRQWSVGTPSRRNRETQRQSLMAALCRIWSSRSGPTNSVGALCLGQVVKCSSQLQGATSLGVVSEDCCVVCRQDVRPTSPFLTICGGLQDCFSGTSWGSSDRKRRRHQAAVSRGPLAIVETHFSEEIRAPDKHLRDSGVLPNPRGLFLWRG